MWYTDILQREIFAAMHYRETSQYMEEELT